MPCLTEPIAAARCARTGRYVIHTGIHTAFSDSVPNVLPIEEVTVAQHLRQAGYATHMVGVSIQSACTCSQAPLSSQPLQPGLVVRHMLAQHT